MHKAYILLCAPSRSPHPAHNKYDQQQFFVTETAPKLRRFTPFSCRHDWVVKRDDGSEARYVIDFYAGHAPPASGYPVAMHLDVRPALDSVDVSGQPLCSFAYFGISVQYIVYIRQKKCTLLGFQDSSFLQVLRDCRKFDTSVPEQPAFVYTPT